MLRTFNCGIGMVAVVEAGEAEAVVQFLDDAGERSYDIGQVLPRADGERSVDWIP
jgi:phosphoribosylaminoimidazole (AIR) synthetase